MSKINNFQFIDSARGIAVLMVVMLHTSVFQIHIDSVFLNWLIGKGGLGVQLFYLASAATLFYSLSVRSTDEKYPYKSFFIRRLFRIAPLYYLAILFYIITYGFGMRNLFGVDENIDIANLFANIFFLHGFNPYWINSLVPGGWSVGIEMLFYLFVPFCYLAYTKYGKNILLPSFIISLFISYAFRTILFNHPLISDNYHWESYISFFLPSQLPVFILGFIVFDTMQKSSKIKFWTILLITFLLISKYQILIIDSQLPFIENQISNSLILGSLLYLTSCFKWKILVNTMTAFIGKISYSVYLVHIALIPFIKTYIIPFIPPTGVFSFILSYIILLFLSIFISLFTYKYIEKNMIVIGSNLLNRLYK